MSEPVWLTVEEALALDAESIARYGGPMGLRDRGLLESALARPQQRHVYEDSGLVALAATAVEGIVRNHPFVDGNKRTGFLVGIVFLAVNGIEFGASQDDAYEAVRALAAGEIDGEAFTTFLAANTRPA